MFKDHCLKTANSAGMKVTTKKNRNKYKTDKRGKRQITNTPQL